jgi:hypothetical protein
MTHGINDTEHDEHQHNDTQLEDILHNGPIATLRINYTELNDTQHNWQTISRASLNITLKNNDTKHNDTHHNDTPYWA